MKNPEADVLSYKIYNEKLSKLKLDKTKVINTLNGHSYNVAKGDKEFKEALCASDVLLADGISIVFGAKVLNGEKIQKIAGYDIFTHLLQQLNEDKASCFFLGASTQTLSLIQDRLAAEYPNVGFASFSPAYKDSFSELDSKKMCQEINAFSPRVLFVGMTAPKQEKWVHTNKYRINADVICSIGAVFDFYAGTTERPAQWIINLKLEWLGRLLKEPKRMWRRYLLSTPVFFIDVFKEKLKRK